jgi:hypothetical protein
MISSFFIKNSSEVSIEFIRDWVQFPVIRFWQNNKNPATDTLAIFSYGLINSQDFEHKACWHQSLTAELEIIPVLVWRWLLLWPRASEIKVPCRIRSSRRLPSDTNSQPLSLKIVVRNASLVGSIGGCQVSNASSGTNLIESM